MDSQENFLNPERIIGLLEIPKGAVIADFGAGHGYFTIPLARAAGPEGRVYALDIQKAGLTIIRTKANLEHLLQVEPVWADLDRPKGSKLPDASADFVLMANMLFQSEKKTDILEEAYRILKPGARALVIEWKPAAPPSPGQTNGAASAMPTGQAGGGQGSALLGPPAALRVSADTVQKVALHIGFSFQKEIPVGTHHYGLLFTKQDTQNA